jgi:hypothetical protein
MDWQDYSQLDPTLLGEALRKVGLGGLLGFTSDVVGAPVDMTVGMLTPPALRTPGEHIPGGSDWIRQKLIEGGLIDAPAERSGEEIAGGMVSGLLNPFGLVKGGAAGVKGLLAMAPLAKMGKAVQEVEAVTPRVVYRGGSPAEAIATEGGEAGTRQYGPGAYFGGQGTAEEFAKFRDKGEVKAYQLDMQKPFDETRQWIAPEAQMNDLRRRLIDIGVPAQYVREMDAPYVGALNNLSRQLGKKRGISAWHAADEINAALREAGFDGIIAEGLGGGEQYVAFNRANIREHGKK